MHFDNMDDSFELEELQKATDELCNYAIGNGFHSDSEDSRVLGEMIYFMTEKSAHGDEEAQYLLGKYILATSNAHEDIAFASQLLSESASHGYRPAQDFLKQIGMSDEALIPEEEVDWEDVIAKAQSGDAEAQYQMALSYMSFESGEDADFSEALEWFAKAADNGHQMAADQLRFWTYADKLMNQGEISRNADFGMIMQTIISKAENGDEEAQAVLM